MNISTLDRDDVEEIVKLALEDAARDISAKICTEDTATREKLYTDTEADVRNALYERAHTTGEAIQMRPEYTLELLQIFLEEIDLKALARIVREVTP